ncbi:MAG: hypothetical protein AAF747_11310 [Planctomycetota bacterium]
MVKLYPLIVVSLTTCGTAMAAEAHIAANAKPASPIGVALNLTDAPKHSNAVSLFTRTNIKQPLSRSFLAGDTYSAEPQWRGTSGSGTPLVASADDAPSSMFVFTNASLDVPAAALGGTQAAGNDDAQCFVIDALVDNGDGTSSVLIEVGFYDLAVEEVVEFVPTGVALVDTTSGPNGVAPITVIQLAIGVADRLEPFGIGGPITLPIAQDGLTAHVFAVDGSTLGSFSVPAAPPGGVGDTADGVGFSAPVVIENDGADLAGSGVGSIQLVWTFQGSVAARCGDITGDGIVNGADIAAAVAGIDAGNSSFDIDQQPGVNYFDLVAYLDAIASNCDL